MKRFYLWNSETKEVIAGIYAKSYPEAAEIGYNLFGNNGHCMYLNCYDIDGEVK